MSKSFLLSTVLSLLAALLISAPPSSAAEITGRVSLIEKGKEKRDREVRTAVVYFLPDQAEAPKPPAEPFQITMTRKSFAPRVLAVPVGSSVRFPNDDRILHNVFSLSPGNSFDLGLYRRGDAKEAKMNSAGVVQIFCNVHHSMVAYVLALDTPYFVQPDPDGSFTLSDLPEGPGRLMVWHERAESTGVDLVIPSKERPNLRLKITKPRVPPHRNKFGKPYKRRRGKAY